MIKVVKQTLSIFTVSLSTILVDPATAQENDSIYDRFRQLDELLPTPNMYRNASGAPAHGYWQQRADYHIQVTIDDAKQHLTGTETIHYTNHSPDTLKYVWVQLDQNRFEKLSVDRRTATADSTETLSYSAARAAFIHEHFQGGMKIHAVRDATANKALHHTVNGTVMRIDLLTPLPTGKSTRLTIDWSYNIPDAYKLNLRGGYEYFEEDGNYIYGLAQWFPRMAAYSDSQGWQLKQFLGAGEFALEFGDYEVEITVPADHIVASTGELQNSEKVLTPTQRQRLEKARAAKAPVFVVTPEEAVANQKSKTKKTKTWRFKAKNVRDFAWASSRKFIWDAQGYQQKSDGRTIMAMSFYPTAGEPLYSMYSTKAIVHTMEVYSRFSFPYPYPTAQVVSGPLADSMEYPMIVFNSPRPEKEGKKGNSYSRQAKYDVISDVIHEIGHIYFPMIVNTDERQWTWMDEGLNSFLQFIAENEWDHDYPSSRGDNQAIAQYMQSTDQVPIMTSSDSVVQFSDNAYSKVAVALNILRETILGRESFDFAFREYAQRWMFKRPNPADFFRTMEDASGTDLDWFWRGWFYSTDYVDISLDKVFLGRIDSADPDIEEPLERKKLEDQGPTLTQLRNRSTERRIDRDSSLKDFYNKYDKFTVTPKQRADYKDMLKDLEDWQKALLKRKENIYFLEFSNRGGLVMPIILRIAYTKGKPEELRIPAEIWRYNAKKAVKMLITDRTIESITVDPYWETADADVSNNHWPRKAIPTRLELYDEDESEDDGDEDRNMMLEMENSR